MIEALIGVVVGVLTIVSARIIRGQHWLYSIGLLALPSLYAFFALQAGEQAVGVKEMIYGVPFVVVGLVFAFVSVRVALHEAPHLHDNCMTRTVRTLSDDARLRHGMALTLGRPGGTSLRTRPTKIHSSLRCRGAYRPCNTDHDRPSP